MSNASAPQPDARRQEDLEAIRRLKARYLRCIDEQRWGELRDVFNEDAVVVGAEHPQGREAIVGHIRTLLTGARTTHHAELESLTLTSDRTATAVWAMTDRVEFGDGSGWSGTGHYHEDYVKQADAWRIARLRLVRQRRDRLSDEGT